MLTIRRLQETWWLWVVWTFYVILGTIGVLQLIQLVKAVRKYNQEQREKQDPNAIDIDNINFDEMFADEAPLTQNAKQ